MSDDYEYRVAAQAHREYEAQRAALTADIAAHKANGDEASGSQALQQLARLELEHRMAANIYRQHVASQQAPRQPYASPEARHARSPGEMDAQDVCDIVNGSKVGGRRLSQEEYLRLRQHLPTYYSQRGRESK